MGREEPVGLLNLAAPQSGPKIHWDPDIVAALDEDFDFDNPENELEDDFFVKANESPEPGAENDESGSEPDWESDGAMSDYSDEARDQVGEMEKEETKSHFTNYSMTSSVIRRNELMSRLDEQFEQLYVKYDEDDIGAMDGEEITGNMAANSELLLQLAAEYKTNKDKVQYIPDVSVECQEYDEDKKEDMEEVVTEQDGDKWDCESVLSTYSNIYNRPKLIEEKPNKIKISHTTGIPLNVMRKGGLTKAGLSELDKLNAASDREHGDDNQSVASRQSLYSLLSLRVKDETPEERRSRRANIKTFRKERRCEKKMNTGAFKSEKKRQEKIALNLNMNLRGVKIV